MIVSGSTLSDEMGIIPNVNIEVVGENRRTVSDANGRFSITVNSPQSQLKFSSVGFYYEILSASEFNQRGYVNLGQSTEQLPDANVNNTHKPDNTLYWVLGIVFIGGIAIAASSKNNIKTA